MPGMTPCAPTAEAVLTREDRPKEAVHLDAALVTQRSELGEGLARPGAVLHPNDRALAGERRYRLRLHNRLDRNGNVVDPQGHARLLMDVAEVRDYLILLTWVVVRGSRGDTRKSPLLDGARPALR